MDITNLKTGIRKKNLIKLHITQSKLATSSYFLQVITPHTNSNSVGKQQANVVQNENTND